MADLLADAKKLERYVYNLPSAKQANTMPKASAALMFDLKQSVYEIKLNISDYFASDEPSEQVKLLEDVTQLANTANDQILLASQHDLLNPVDVAHLSAMVEQIKERL